MNLRNTLIASLSSGALLPLHLCLADVPANPSFEAPDPILADAPAGWIRNPVDAPAGWTSEVARDGEKSVRVDASGQFGAYWLTEGRMPVRPGQALTLEGWIKTNQAWGDNGIGISWYDANIRWISTARSENINGTHDWTRVILHASAPEGAASARILVGRRFRTETGSSWFDDIQLTAEEETSIHTPNAEPRPPDWGLPATEPLSWVIAPPSSTVSPESSQTEWRISTNPSVWQPLLLGMLSQKELELAAPAPANTGWITQANIPIKPGQSCELSGIFSLYDALGGTSLAISWLNASGDEISRSLSGGIDGRQQHRLLSVRAVAPPGTASAKAIFLRQHSTKAVPGSGKSVCKLLLLRICHTEMAGVGGNLVANPSVEKPATLNIVEKSGNSGLPGTPDQWFEIGEADAALEWSEKAAYSGAHALAICDSHGEKAGWMSAPFPISGGVSYRISMRLQLENAYNIRVAMEWIDAGNNGIAMTVSPTVGGSMEWRKITMEANAPKNAKMARLIVTQSRSSGSSIFDDFSVEAIP